MFARHLLLCCSLFEQLPLSKDVPSFSYDMILFNLLALVCTKGLTYHTTRRVHPSGKGGSWPSADLCNKALKLSNSPDLIILNSEKLNELQIRIRECRSLIRDYIV